ncbi:MAG TPA: response regulator transcription factor [Candidatus Sulfotelmatobacter sp.]|nr:response regulator transcription factor [Candidatus Sulfotelmatobacter sp.]
MLVVDDDPKIVRLVGLYLQRAGFEVLAAGDGRTALDLVHDRRPALVILDVMLPQVDGLAVLDAIRRDGETPVVMLSARGTTDDRIAGLAGGADDYVAKPFSPAELILRVSRVLERAQRQDPDEPTLRLGDLELDPARHSATVAGRMVELTATEFRLMAAIVAAEGRVLTRARLLDLVYGALEDEVLDRTVDVHVGRLREKLGDTATGSRYVVTVRGVGYRAGTGGEAPR